MANQRAGEQEFDFPHAHPDRELSIVSLDQSRLIAGWGPTRNVTDNFFPVPYACSISYMITEFSLATKIR